VRGDPSRRAAPVVGASDLAVPGDWLRLSDGLPTDAPAWHDLPSWFVFGDQDLNIPVRLHRFMADRAGSKVSREMAGASHAPAP
jgi:pimeloyl-ACP methyl ester carboxylesterase